VAKFKEEFEGRAKKPIPPSMPPEILPEQLIEHTEIASRPGPHMEATHDTVAIAGSTSAPDTECASHEH
jgi:hypothetical protein